MNRQIRTNGSLCMLINENGLQVITLATGASVTYNPTEVYKALCYAGADALCYVATETAIFSIDPTDGTTVKIGDMPDVQALAPIGADNLAVLRGASLITYVPSTEAEAYVRQDLN